MPVRSPSRRLLLRRRAVVERADHLVGDVDARAGVDSLLEDDVELLRLRDLPHRAVGALEDSRQLFVAPLVEVLAELALLALELARGVLELALALRALRLRHRHRVLLERFLQALEAFGAARELLLALLELRLQLLLRAHGGRGVAQDPVEIHEPDLVLGEAAAGGEHERQRRDEWYGLQIEPPLAIFA